MGFAGAWPLLKDSDHDPAIRDSGVELDPQAVATLEAKCGAVNQRTVRAAGALAQLYRAWDKASPSTP